MARKDVPARDIFLWAFLVATHNVYRGGYLKAFTKFVSTDVSIASQMSVIVPTALTMTALSYTGWCALGAWLGQRALGVVASHSLRCSPALCFVGYGVVLLLL